MSTSPSLLHVRRPSPTSSDLLSTTIIPSTVMAKLCLPELLPAVEAEDQVEVVLTACTSNLSMSDPTESSISIDTTDDCAALSTSPLSTHSEASTSNHSLALSRISSRSAFKSFFIEALTGVNGISPMTSSASTYELKRERSLPEGVLGYALSKDSWTPDSDALSCFHPSCPVTFSALSLSNRRHHCRMCGQIYCSAHTARSAPLLSPFSSIVRNERVCESCIDESSGTANLQSAGSSAISLTELALDGSRQQPHVTRAAFRPSFNRSHSNPSSFSSESKPRAPIQPWMDGQGVLSLYPLATKRSRRAISPNEPTAAAPLFAPNGSAKKHKFRAAEPEFVPANWGYRREAFDESYTLEDGDESSEDEEESKGGLVVNGPFMLRAHPERFVKKHSAPPALLAGVTKAYAGDWSTF